MKKTLSHVAETAGRLFDHPQDPPITITGTVPKCRLCGNRGYVNCPQGHAPNGGCFIAIAFEQGTACSCPAGAQFAKDQMEWMQ